MIRIATTDIRVGDRVRTSRATEGIVTKYRRGYDRPYMEIGTNKVHMTSAGTVELLSDLGDREACKSFGRW